MFNRKSYDEQYNSSADGRVRTIRQWHKRRYGELTHMDDLTGNGLLKLLEVQNYECAACHQPFDDLDEVQIGHITPAGVLNVKYVQCICEKDNRVQRDLVIPFQWFEANYGMSFYEYFVTYPDQIQEWFSQIWKPSDFKRIERRCLELGLFGGGK
jgi:hypothetical protein